MCSWAPVWLSGLSRGPIHRRACAKAIYGAFHLLFLPGFLSFLHYPVAIKANNEEKKKKKWI